MPPKKTIQDIKPSRKATIVRKKVAETRAEATKILTEEGILPREKVVHDLNHKNPISGWSIWLLVSCAFIFFVFMVSLLFKGVIVTITPKNTMLPDTEILLTAKKDSTTGLSFQTISVEGERATTVSSENQSVVDQVATGIVTLYNNNSTSPQNLLIDTRLSSSEGKIYKTKTAVVIPGKKSVDGKIVPGQIDVEVYADTAGESGNLDLSDFTVLGFKGTSKEKTIYGRSKTKISGGFIGELYSLSPESAEKAQSEIQLSLKNDLQSKLEAQIPDDFLLVSGSEEYTTLEKTNSYTSDNSSVPIFEKGILTSIIVDKSILAKAVAGESLSDYLKGTPVYIENIDSLEVSFVGTVIGIKDLIEAPIAIKGRPHVVWALDEDRIKYELLDTRKKQFETIMEKYEYIVKADLTLRPFWHRSLPEKIEDIDIKYIFE